MPNVKNQFLRIKTINKCLRDFDNQYGWSELSQACLDAFEAKGDDRDSITRKTIYNDLDYIKANYEVVIETHKIGKKAYYRYESPDMTIDTQPLSTNELERLKEALSTLSNISGRNEFDFIADLLPRLETSLDVQIDIKPIISYQKNDDLKNGDLVNAMYQYIRKKTVLDIRYRANNGEEYSYSLHPYFLKQYNNRWFLFGYDKESYYNGRYPLNLPIDRIQSHAPTVLEYRENEDIDFTEYFDEIIGVTKYSGVDAVDIKIKISSFIYPYINTKPLHPFQKKIMLADDGSYYTSIKLIPNPEMYALFLSYGSDLTVISPESVVTEIRNKTQSSFNNYK